MILTTYDPGNHGLLDANFALDPKPNSPLGDILQVVEAEGEHLIVQFERFDWETLQTNAIAFDKDGSGLWIRYLSGNLTPANFAHALKIAIIDYLDVFYLKGAAIEFADEKITPKKFAEIVHGFQSDERFSAFLKLQWQPHKGTDCIRFTFQPKR